MQIRTMMQFQLRALKRFPAHNLSLMPADRCESGTLRRVLTLGLKGRLLVLVFLAVNLDGGEQDRNEDRAEKQADEPIGCEASQDPKK